MRIADYVQAPQNINNAKTDGKKMNVKIQNKINYYSKWIYSIAPTEVAPSCQSKWNQTAIFHRIHLYFSSFVCDQLYSIIICLFITTALASDQIS